MNRIFLIIPIAITLAGCPQADILAGKESSYKAHVENMALVTKPESPKAAVAPPEAVIEAVTAPEPPCIEEFRIRRCEAGKPVEWYYL